MKIQVFRCCHGGCDSSAATAIGYQSLVMLGWRVDDVTHLQEKKFYCPLHYPLSEEEHLAQVNGVQNIMQVLAAVGDGPLHIPEVERLLKEALFIVSVHPVLSLRMKVH